MRNKLYSDTELHNLFDVKSWPDKFDVFDVVEIHGVSNSCLANNTLCIKGRCHIVMTGCTDTSTNATKAFPVFDGRFNFSCDVDGERNIIYFGCDYDSHLKLTIPKLDVNCIDNACLSDYLNCYLHLNEYLEVDYFKTIIDFEAEDERLLHSLLNEE